MIGININCKYYDKLSGCYGVCNSPQRKKWLWIARRSCILLNKSYCPLQEKYDRPPPPAPPPQRPIKRSE